MMRLEKERETKVKFILDLSSLFQKVTLLISMQQKKNNYNCIYLEQNTFIF